VVAKNADGDLTASSTLSATSTLPDIDPPTPNPVTFEQSTGIPTNASISQIDMTSNTVTDPSSPVSYYFTSVAGSCGVNAGTGGTDSGWQSADTTYSDTGLQTNKCYGYTITTRDSIGNTGSVSTASSTYTSAATPGVPVFQVTTPYALILTNDENGNPTSNPVTDFAVQIINTSPLDSTWENMYIDATGNPSVSAVWLTDAQLDNLIVLQLLEQTSYDVRAKARNQDGEETPWSNSGTATSGIILPVGVRIQGGRYSSGRLQ